MRARADDKLSLEITRVLKAPRARVYAAWTDPVEIIKWFGPEDVQTTHVIADARPGGELRWDLTTSEGEAMTMRGEYRELHPERKIVFTWRWEDDETWDGHISVVTVELKDHDSGTELRLTHERLPTEQSRDNHTEGWSGALEKLQRMYETTAG